MRSVRQLTCKVVEQDHRLSLSPRDATAIDEIVSWKVAPTFVRPGRTAWYVLQDPITAPDGGPTYFAAKLKGVGAWNPDAPGTPSGVKGDYPRGLGPPSVTEYAETARTPHFGIDLEGRFARVNSEAAPFGAILLRRARQEYENADRLVSSGVSAIAPYALYQYSDLSFNSDALGAVVCLAPDASPHALDFLYQREDDPSPERRHHFQSVLHALRLEDGVQQDAAISAQCKVASLVGDALRRFSAAGLYRYSSGWDNFYLTRRTGAVYLTDLDSSRPWSELPAEVAGLQVMRDLAGALWRLPKQYSEAGSVADVQLPLILAQDPLACTVTAFFGVDEAQARCSVAPLWDYAIPHLFLLKRHASALPRWSKEERKTYRIEKGLFHCLAILSLADLYRRRRLHLGLPPIPAQDVLLKSAEQFLGDQMPYVDWMLQGRRSGWAPYDSIRPDTSRPQSVVVAAP